MAEAALTFALLLNFVGLPTAPPFLLLESDLVVFETSQAQDLPGDSFRPADPVPEGSYTSTPAVSSISLASEPGKTENPPGISHTGLVVQLEGDISHGGEATIRVVADSAFGFTEINVLCNLGSAVLSAAAPEITIPIENAASGELVAFAIAKAADGTVHLSDDVRRSIAPPATAPSAINYRGGSISLVQGEVARLHVTGDYGATGTHIVNPSELDVSVADPAIVRVVQNTYVQALADGANRPGTIVTVGVGQHTVEIPVNLMPGERVNNSPRLDLDETIAGCAGDQVCIDASSTTDCDDVFGDQLSFDWDLDGDGQFGDASGSMECIVFPSVVHAVVRVRVADTSGATSIGVFTFYPDPGGCLDSPR